MAGQRSIQQALEFHILNGVNETGHDLAFNAVVKTWNFKETLLIGLNLTPKLFVFKC